MTIKIAATFPTRREADDFAKAIEDGYPAGKFATSLKVDIVLTSDGATFTVTGSREEKPK